MIGLDLGTTNCKAVLLDADGRVKAAASDGYRLQVPHPSAAERAFVLLPWSWMDPVALDVFQVEDAEEEEEQSPAPPAIVPRQEEEQASPAVKPPEGWAMAAVTLRERATTTSSAPRRSSASWRR